MDAARAGRTRRLPGHLSRQLGRRTAQAGITGAAHVIRELSPVAGSGGPLSRRRRLRTRRAPLRRTGLKRTALRHARAGHGEGRGRQPVPWQPLRASPSVITSRRVRQHADGSARAEATSSLRTSCSIGKLGRRQGTRRGARQGRGSWLLAVLRQRAAALTSSPATATVISSARAVTTESQPCSEAPGVARRNVRTAAVSACSQSTGQETVAARPRG